MNKLLEQSRADMKKHIAARLHSLEALLESMAVFQLPDDSEAAYHKLSAIAGQLEMLVLELRMDLRELHRCLAVAGLEPAYYKLPGTADVTIREENGGFLIVLDALLPLPIKGSVFYLHENLDRALQDFQPEQTGLPFEKRCVIMFIHHYKAVGKTIPHLRDYDNMERRCILNVIARYFLWDDSPACYLSVETIVPDIRDFTEIRILPLPVFQQLILSENIP